MKYVARKDNAPNVPQARPIERYWAILALCKKEYKNLKKQPKKQTQFTRKWKMISTKVAENSAQNLMKVCRRNVRKIANEGVYSVL